MNQKVSNKFAIAVWDKMNIFLAVATAVTTIVFITLFILSFMKTLGASEQGFALGMCGVFASLSSAFFIAWVMRMYDRSKRKEQELKALVMLRPYLQKTVATINNFFPQFKSFVIVNPDDTIQYPHEIVYYTDPSKGDGNRSFVDLNLAFKNAYSQLDNDLQDCLSAPILFQCNEIIIDLLTGLKLNGLTQKLLEIYKSSSEPFFSNVSFMGLHKYFVEFSSFYEMLVEAAIYKPVGNLQELSSEEKKVYIQEIETIKKQLPVNHMGMIFKGNIRIQ